MNQTFIAKTIAGLEEVLAAELVELGAGNVQVLKRAVSFEGDMRMLYKANYCLRTAQRILMPLYSFQLDNEDDLYRHVNDYAWENHLSLQKTLAVDAVVSDSELTHSHYVALRTKDAIVDRFRTLNNGRRPSVDIDNPHIRINIHIRGNACDVSLDSSGASLHKRGYRVSNAEAPMSEVLAAGLIQLSGWKRDCHFVDPMCGSGTLLIEAAMYANNFPAGMYRKEFGFMHWPSFDEQLWNEVTSEALYLQTEFEFQIVGSDISPQNLSSARANLKAAKLHKDVRIFVSPITALQPPPGKPGIMIINPPYGERIRLNDIVGLYKSIGDVLKREFPGYNAWVISSDQKALTFIGLKPAKKFTVYNGQLECRYVNFDLYKGSKRGRYIDEQEDTAQTAAAPETAKPFAREEFKAAADRKFSKRDDDAKPREHSARTWEKKPERPYDSKPKYGDEKPRRGEKTRSDADKRPFRSDDPADRQPFWKKIAKDDTEPKQKQEAPAEPEYKPRQNTDADKAPSQGSKFSSFKDYEVKREREMRPRKNKKEASAPAPEPLPGKAEKPAAKPAAKPAVKTASKPAPPVNYDDLED